MTEEDMFACHCFPVSIILQAAIVSRDGHGVELALALAAVQLNIFTRCMKQKTPLFVGGPSLLRVEGDRYLQTSPRTKPRMVSYMSHDTLHSTTC